MRILSAVLVPLAAAALIVTPASQAGEHEWHCSQNGGRNISFKSFSTFEADEARFHLGKDEIEISHLADPFEEIVITNERRMYIDDVEVPLTPQQQELVGEFYDVSFEIRAEAKAIAKEGLHLGLKGAKLGLHAVGAALKMLFTDWDEEKFERKMDSEAEKLEAEAERLEAWAEQLEEMAERWEELGLQMKDDIAPLREMDWL